MVQGAGFIALSKRRDVNSRSFKPDFGSFFIYNPLKSTSLNNSDGIRHDDYLRMSLPASDKLFHKVIMFPVTFISEIGCVVLPFSIWKPSIP